MLKPNPNADVNGTSFHDSTVTASLEQLEKAFGPAHSDGDGYKVSNEWSFEHDGNPVTLYDWKEGRFPRNRQIEWHVGGHNKAATEAAAIAIFKAVHDMK